MLLMECGGGGGYKVDWGGSSYKNSDIQYSLLSFCYDHDGTENDKNLQGE